MRIIAKFLLRRSLFFWATAFTIFAVGAWQRINSIDRATPALGIAAYAALLLLFVATVAMPAGMVSGAAARFLLRWSISPMQLRIVVFLCVGVAVSLLHHIGRSSPPWHVWASSAIITALLAMPAFRWGRLLVIAWYADRATERIESTRRASAHDLRNVARTNFR